MAKQPKNKFICRITLAEDLNVNSYLILLVYVANYFVSTYFSIYFINNGKIANSKLT